MIQPSVKLKTISAVIFILFSQLCVAQTLTLEEVFQLARQNYPLIQKQDLIQQSTKYSLENAAKLFLPQFTINGQATYQSEVTQIPINMPGVKALSKDQYRLQGEISQLIYDGGIIKNQKELLKANEAVQLQNTEVNLYAVKEKMAQLYFSILLFDAQLKQSNILKQNLIAALKKAEANLKEGIVFKSTVNELKAEILNTEMSETELRSDRKSYKEMLALFIGKSLNDDAEFIMPQQAEISQKEIKRPELKLFDLQKNTLNLQEQKLKTNWHPRLSAFVQGGYGRPGLNMLNNNFSTWAMGGLRLNFPLNSLYTLKNDKTILDLNRKQIEKDEEIFLLNTKVSLQKENNDIEKYQELIRHDDKMILLREEIAKSAEAQLANGVITTSEYINKLNAENLARQMKNLHIIQLLKAKTDYQITVGE
jgi:outer membrane protein TolC